MLTPLFMIWLIWSAFCIYLAALRTWLGVGPGGL